MEDSQIKAAILEGGRQKENIVNYLIHQHIGFVHQILQKTILNADEAKDAYTDAILALVQAIENEKFKGESKLSTFLYKIFYFKSVDLSRKKSTNRIDYKENLPDVNPAETDLFESLLIKDEVKKLKSQLDELGDPCRQILMDWGFWGYSMSEIAQRTGLADAGKAKRQKYQCLQKLIKRTQHLKHDNG